MLVGVLCSIVMIMLSTALSTNFFGKVYAQDNEHYIVKKGDTLYRMAKHYGTTVEWLREKNDLLSNQIFIGPPILIIFNYSIRGFVDFC